MPTRPPPARPDASVEAASKSHSALPWSCMLFFLVFWALAGACQRNGVGGFLLQNSSSSTIVAILYPQPGARGPGASVPAAGQGLWVLVFAGAFQGTAWAGLCLIHHHTIVALHQQQQKTTPKQQRSQGRCLKTNYDRKESELARPCVIARGCSDRTRKRDRARKGAMTRRRQIPCPRAHEHARQAPRASTGPTSTVLTHTVRCPRRSRTSGPG